MENESVEAIILGFLYEVIKFGMLILAVICIGLSLYGYVGG